MNAQRYISIDAIANFSKVKEITEDRSVLLQAMQQCKNLVAAGGLVALEGSAACCRPAAVRACETTSCRDRDLFAAYMLRLIRAHTHACTHESYVHMCMHLHTHASVYTHIVSTCAYYQHTYEHPTNTYTRTHTRVPTCIHASSTYKHAHKHTHACMDTPFLVFTTYSTSLVFCL